MVLFKSVLGEIFLKYGFFVAILYLGDVPLFSYAYLQKLFSLRCPFIIILMNFTIKETSSEESDR